MFVFKTPKFVLQTSVGHEELEDLSLEHSAGKRNHVASNDIWLTTTQGNMVLVHRCKQHPPPAPKDAGGPEQHWGAGWSPEPTAWRWDPWLLQWCVPSPCLEIHTFPPGCSQTADSEDTGSYVIIKGSEEHSNVKAAEKLQSTPYRYMLSVSLGV